ncbi:hypothetical protein [Rhodopseudomonas sp. RCAM05734]|uniref:hypothetical protein n=1 Tax=Rhodopseudomonas sp. RCAM05734 TaxID=3457549 RepID=UPI0040440C54
MSDHCTVLHRLIIASENTLRLHAPGTEEFLTQLSGDVARALDQAAPDGRVIHPYAMLLMGALVEAGGAIQIHNADGAQVYFRIIGCLLPDIRADFGRALELRKRPTP